MLFAVGDTPLSWMKCRNLFNIIRWINKRILSQAPLTRVLVAWSAYNLVCMVDNWNKFQEFLIHYILIWELGCFQKLTKLSLLLLTFKDYGSYYTHRYICYIYVFQFLHSIFTFMFPFGLFYANRILGHSS